MAEASQFTPNLTKEQTRQSIKLYEKVPSRFGIEQLDNLRNHAQYHNVPFYEGDFSILDAVKQAGVGLVEGFTTLNIGKEHPDNEWEAVSRSIGHLVGFAPGILSGPLGWVGKAAKINSIKNASLALKGARGIPLKIAEDIVQPRATKVAQKILNNSSLGRIKAFDTFKKFVSKGVVEDISAGAFKLGTASGISAWQGGVDQMIHSFFSGAVFGGGFAAIGNAINMKNPKAEMFARGLSGSLFQGLPSTIRGATTPEQIYEYLMGAYFGGKEKPWTEKRAAKELQKGIKEARKSPKSQFEETLDPEMFSNWPNIPQEVRPVLRKMASDWVGQKVHQAGMPGYELAKTLKVEGLDKKIGEKPKEIKDIPITAKAPKVSRKKPVTPEETIKESRKDTFVITSGDKGIQEVVSQEAYKAGLTEVQALFQGQTTRGKTPNTQQVILDRAQLDNANKSISNAIQIINQRVKETGYGKEIDTSSYPDYVVNVLRRDAAKLDKNYAQSVVAIDPINGLMNETMGLSRIPIQIAINKRKKVFAFDDKLGWTKYNYNSKKFEIIPTIPELSRRTAFFGTNDPNKVQIGQIQNLFKIHASKGFKEEIASKVKITEESDKIDTIEYSEAELAQSAIDYKLSGMMQRGLNDVIKKIETDVVKRYDAIAKFADKAGKLVMGVDSQGKKFLRKGKETNSREWIELIQKEVTKFNKDAVIPNHLKRSLRQWLVIQNQSYPIYTGGYIMGEGVNIIGPDTPFTKSGVLRKQEGPVKFIEEIYLDASNKDLATNKDPIIVSFSDITYKNNKGNLMDVELSRLETTIARDIAPRFQKYKDAVNTAKEQVKLIYKDIIERMQKEHNMHIWGGEGDKDKIVFVKYHPEYKKVKLPKLPESSYKFALDTYGIDRVTRDKMTKSIIKYTESLNQGRPIEKIAGQPGFIKNAIHDNKRNPLWMSNGWRGDKSFWMDPANHGQDLKLTKVKLPNVKVKYDSNLKSGISDRIVGARTDRVNNQILIDPNRLLLDFQNKAWTKPKVEGVKPLPKNAFKDFTEYEAFVIRHEKAHFLPENMAIKDLAARENHANDVALGKMDGNAKAVFVSSPKQLDNLIGVKNSEILQATDGGIIINTPTGKATRADKGVPDSGQEKSIAVIPSPDGTKLLKYMMHETTPEGSKMMENYVNPKTGEVGLNYIIYDSAAKQVGEFPVGNYRISKGKLELTDGAKIFEIDPGDFRYNYGVYDSHHSLGKNDAGKVIGLGVPKQMIMIPNTSLKGINQKVINDYIDTLSGQSYRGTDSANIKVMEYISSKEPKLIDGIMKDFDNVGIKEIEAVIRDKGSEALAERMLVEILKTNKTQIESLMGEGEMSIDKGAESIRSIIDINGTADNIVKHAAALKEPAISLLFDKYSRHYVENAINNFVADRVMKPKMKNSMKARLRPYDKFLKEAIPELNSDSEAMKKFGVKADELFFLDNYGEQIPIFANVKGYEGLYGKNLKEFWKAFNTAKVQKNKDLKQEFLDIFDAVNIRVPVDAISGAQVLRFGGFTGVNGHGVLMHGRKVELLGGADHDADTAFIFFGGRKQDGSGEGMKKSWVDMFRAGKDEFIVGKEMLDPKKLFKDDIVLNKEKLSDMGINPEVFDWTNNTNNKHPYMQFTPDIRLYTGQNTAQSRNAMGPVVSMTQNMRAAWHSVRQNKNKSEEIERGTITHKAVKKGKVTTYEPIPVEQQWKFRVSREAKEFDIKQNWLSSALIRFTADPANELGLIPFGQMKNLLTNLYFEKPVIELYNPKTEKWTDLTSMPKHNQDYWKNFLQFQIGTKRKFSKDHFKESRFDLIDGINRAFFGYDFVNKKDFSYEQKQEMVKRLDDLSTEELSTAMPQIGRMLKDVDFRVSIYDKLNKDAYYDMMQKQKDIGKTLSRTTDYKKLLDRTVLYRPQSKYIDFAFAENLNNPFVRKKFSEDIPLLLDKLNKYGIKNDGKLFPEIKETDLPSEALIKIKSLEDVTKDFLSNSVDEIGSLSSILKRYGDARNAGIRIPESEMIKISKEAEAIKDLSSQQYLRRKKAVYDSDTTDLSRLSEVELELYKMYFPDVRKKPTKLLDQSQLDNRIVQFKEGLSSDYARDVFDLRLLGSLRSENTVNLINKYLKLPKNERQNNLIRDLVRTLFKTGTKSSTTKVGYDSKAVSSKNILRFLKEKNDLYTTISKEPPKKYETAIENLKKTKEFQAIQAEKDKDIRTAGTILEEVNGFENLKKGKLNKEQTKEVLELANWLKHEPDFRKEKLNETVMGIYQKIDPEGISKTLDQLNINDIKLMNNYFKFMKEGTAIQKIEDAVKKYKTAIEKASLKKRNHFQFVEGITEEMMREHLVFLPSQGYYKTKDGSPGKFAETLKPTYYGEVLMNWASRSAEQSSGKVAEINNKFINDLRFLNQVEEQGVNPLGLYQLAISRYELQTRERRELERDWYQENWDQLKKHWGWDKIRLKKFNIDFGDGKGRTPTTGAKIVDKIQRLHESTYDFLLEIQKGKPEALKKYHIPGAYWQGDKTQPKLDWRRFREDLVDDYNNNRLINIDIGGDGIRHVLKSYMAENMPTTEYMREFKDKEGKTVTKKISKKEWLKFSKKDRKQWTPDSDINWEKLSKMKIYDTKKRNGYYPHLFNSKSEAIKGRVEEVAALQKRFKNGELTEEAYLNEWSSLENKYARMLGDYNFKEYEMTDIVDMALFPEIKQHLSEKEIKRRDMSNLPSITSQPGHAQKRESHTPGWIIDPAVNTIYIKNTVDSIYRQIANFMTRDTLNTMKDHMYKKWVAKAKNEKDRKDGQELVNNWLTFWHNYTREAQGMPSVVTTEMWNNPKLYYSNTPAGWFADNIVSNKLNKIADKLGLTDAEIPEGMKGTKAIDMQKWSQVEARFQLATLMTHPKTPINNVFGGTMHTFQSVGYEPMRKARDYDYLQTIFPKWKTRADVYETMDKFGIQSELLRHEYGFDRNFQTNSATGRKNKAFMDEISDKIKGGKEISKEMLVSVAKERGISDKIVDIAGKYMSIPERMLRTDAFLSHYIKNWERFGGAIKDPEHPFLIEMAKKGVKATQFLYNAPNRPAIARSGLGKVMTRFQLWSWNAVRFRNDIRKQAKIYGFKSGTEAMKRFERMMTTDMFVLALGSVFMYSLFGQVIPAPWNWLQDSAEWVFGDEKERNRAFFGMYPGALAPLQMITPPIARFPISAIRQFAEDDYNKLADYYIYTMFPFGRQIRDLVHPDSNIIENPMRAPEKLLGIPLTGMAKEAKKRKREPKYESSIPGLSIY